MEPRTVYAMSSGEYSDYAIKALFETKELAEAACIADKANDRYSSYDDNRVETFYLYDEVPEPLTRYFMSVEIFDDGTTGLESERAEAGMPWSFWDDPVTNRPQVRWHRPPYISNRGAVLSVWGSDLKGVQKAFSDRKYKILAELKGLS